MEVKGIKTRLLVPPQDNLLEVIDESVSDLQDGSVLAIASKVVAVHQGRTVKIDEPREKQQLEELIEQEADKTIPRIEVPGGLYHHTITKNILAGTAGIDASNGNGYFILWPEQPSKFAEQVRKLLINKFDVHHVGVVITDSHSQPLRYGTVGYAIGGAGLEPLLAYEGKDDLFGRKFKYQQSNNYDGLAAASTVVMGEGAESRPLALLTHLPKQIKFSETAKFSDMLVKPEEDIFKPLLEDFK